MIEILLPDRTLRATTVARLRDAVDLSVGDEHLVLYAGPRSLVLPQRVDPDRLLVALAAFEDLDVVALRTEPPRCDRCLSHIFTQSGTRIR